jgi:hypothetical protein
MIGGVATGLVDDKWRSRTSGFGAIPHLRVRCLSGAGTHEPGGKSCFDETECSR